MKNNTEVKGNGHRISATAGMNQLKNGGGKMTTEQPKHTPTAICTGCLRDDQQVGEFTKDDPVEGDGTYEDGKFVCTECYVKLIPLGLDVGLPAFVQNMARVNRAKAEGRD